MESRACPPSRRGTLSGRRTTLDSVHVCAYTMNVNFGWDPGKAAANLEKHGVDFADAAVALEDQRAFTVEDPDVDEEQRFVSLCLDPLGRVRSHCDKISERTESQAAKRWAGMCISQSTFASQGIDENVK